MESKLRGETADTLKLIAEKIIDFQVDKNIDGLRDQLNRAAIEYDNAYTNVVLFNLDETDREFDASSPLDVEARVNDTSGNLLHAIIYLDKRGNLLALEIFPWDEWHGIIDVASLAPATFDGHGVSKS